MNSLLSTSKVIAPTTINGRYLNVGCGRRYHRAWVNLDLESRDPEVITHDVNQGIPFDDNHFDAVYHSHILEHLTPEQGRGLIRECVRVLRPGGVLRIAVPDLERIAKLYLEMHQQAWSGDDSSLTDYKWMKLELLDQLVRERSGGQMGRYMSSREIKNSEFVRSRVGDEMLVCQSETQSEPRANADGKGGVRNSMLTRISKSSHAFRRRMARRFVRWTLGRAAESAFDEGYFRSQGEIHRWMYDRLSLRELCESSGLVDFRVCRADESQIANYAEFELDSVGEQIRKPDSIFVECNKAA